MTFGEGRFDSKNKTQITYGGIDLAMPTYEYKCQNCGEELEAFHSMTAEPLKKCPACGKDTLKRLLGTGAGIFFKGSGFYCTDYRAKGKESDSSGFASPTISKKKAAKSSGDDSKKKSKSSKGGNT